MKANESDPETSAPEPSVWIVLLNWNGWRDTLACLKSLDALNYRNWHPVVVDNASGDDSVSRIRTGRPDIDLIEAGGNLGFSGGCNVGIRHALEHGADYVWLLNNDATVDAGTLGAMVDLAEREKTIGAVGSVLYYMDRPDMVQAWGGGWIDYWKGQAGHYLTSVPEAKLQYLTAASILIRRKAFGDVGLFDENNFFMYWEDVDFSSRLRKCGWRLAVAVNSHVLHKENGSTGKVNLLRDSYYAASAVRFFRLHAQFPVWPIAVGAIGRLAKRALMGNFSGFLATARGIFVGLKNAD